MNTNSQTQIGGFYPLDYELKKDIDRMVWDKEQFTCILEEVVFWGEVSEAYNIALSFDMQLIHAHVIQFKKLYSTKWVLSDKDKKKEHIERSKFYSYLLGELST